MEGPSDMERGTEAGLDAPYLCFLLLGCGTLFPWNALITAANYWEARYPGKHTDRLLTVAYLPINLVVIAAMVHWHARMRPVLRIVTGLVGFTLAIAAVPLLDLAPASSGTLAVLLLLVAACGLCDGLAQGALFGEAARLPPRFTQALIAGTAVSGVVVSVLRVVTKATLPDTEQGLRQSANLYFAIAALVCAACTVVYSYVLPRLPAVQQYKHAALEAALHGDDDLGLERHEGQGPGSLASSAAASPWKQHRQQQQQPARSSIDVELSYEDHVHGWGQQDGEQQQQLDSRPATLAEESAGQALLGGGAQHTMSNSRPGEWLHDHWQAGQQQQQQYARAGQAAQAGALTAGAVFRMLWRLATANALIYTITLSIFPGVLAEDVHSAELGSWYPVALLTAFNFADWAGKSLPGVPALRVSNERIILGATLLRVLFIPAFYFAAVGGAMPAIIGTLALLLGASNGFLSSCAMMRAPSLVPPAAGELAGNMMVLFLILGLCIGAACGFLWLLAD
ncbi:hypothetical protein ABPG75_000824 [Micractinium tetrahymenae]